MPAPAHIPMGIQFVRKKGARANSREDGTERQTHLPANEEEE